MSGVDELAELLARPAGATLDTGAVTGEDDAKHLQVDLGDRTVTVTVPENLAGLAGVGAFVRVSVQGNTAVLDAVLSGSFGGAFPVGGGCEWYTNTPPPGWLLLDGSTFDPVEYPALYQVLGTTQLVDRRNRVGVGKGSGTFATLGATGGSETVTLTIAQMPQHSHAYGTDNAGSLASSGTLPVHGTAFNTADYETSEVGGGQAHPNMPPYRVVNYIIKAR